MKKIFLFAPLFMLVASPLKSLCAVKRKKTKAGKLVEVNFDDELRIKGKLLGPQPFYPLSKEKY